MSNDDPRYKGPDYQLIHGAVLKPEFKIQQLIEEYIKQNRYSRGTNISIDFSDLSRELGGYFTDALRSEAELAHLMEVNNANSQELLGVTKINTMINAGVHQELVEAALKRDEAVYHLSEHTVQLGSINRNLIRGIEGLDRINQSVVGMEQTIGQVGSHLSCLLQDIGSGISKLTEEEIKTRMQLLQSVYNLKDVFVWSHREQMGVARKILDALLHPLGTMAAELWREGEKLRLMGRLDDAVKMFERSVDLKPSEYRSHFSLGLTSIELLDTERAKRAFDDAKIYSDEDPAVQAYSILLQAKLHIQEHHFEHAYKLLLEASSIESNDYNIFYEIAVCLINMGDKKNAKDLLIELVKRNPDLLNKIRAEQCFQPIYQEIYEYFTKDTNPDNDFRARLMKLLKD